MNIEAFYSAVSLVKEVRPRFTDAARRYYFCDEQAKKMGLSLPEEEKNSSVMPVTFYFDSSKLTSSDFQKQLELLAPIVDSLLAGFNNAGLEVDFMNASAGVNVVSATFEMRCDHYDLLPKAMNSQPVPAV